MNYESFLKSQSDPQLQALLQTQGVPAELVQQELMQRAKLRTASEGNNTSPEFMGLGAIRNG